MQHSNTPQGFSELNIDALDAEHRKLAFERLHFLDFIARLNQQSTACHCHSGPAFILSEGPSNEPGARRKIECGICHKFIAWLPKLKNKDRRPTASVGLASADYCQCCRQTDRPLIGHHIIEVAEGGDNSPSNLWTLCEPCHTIVHALRRGMKASDGGSHQ